MSGQLPQRGRLSRLLSQTPSASGEAPPPSSRTVNTGCNAATKMQRTTYTPEQRAEALALLATVGKAEAARRCGIPAGTIASWGSRSGVQAPPAAATAVATAARVATVAERKAALADGLAVAAERMLGDLFAGTLERKAFGPTRYTDETIVDVEHATTTPAERKVTIEAIAKAVETVQVLIGAATAPGAQPLAEGVAPPAERTKAEATILQLVGGAAA